MSALGKLLGWVGLFAIAAWLGYEQGRADYEDELLHGRRQWR